MNDTEKIVISLDSNVFRNQEFINFLIAERDKFVIFIPSIVFIETSFYYLTRGLMIDDFKNDIRDFGGKFLDLNSQIAIDTAINAKKTKISFKHHARDFVIGTTSLSKNAILITYNIKDFIWMPKDKFYNPESLFERYKAL
jgi:predicted nucleic acid-binding protein